MTSAYKDGDNVWDAHARLSYFDHFCVCSVNKNNNKVYMCAPEAIQNNFFPEMEEADYCHFDAVPFYIHWWWYGKTLAWSKAYFRVL